MNAFDSKLVKLNVSVLNKENLLEKMVDDLYLNGVISKKEGYFNALKAREADLSTGIGFGIALPHSRHDDVKEFKIAIYILKNELEYNSLDDNPVKIVLMVAVPTSENSNYIDMLSFIGKSLRKEDDRNFLLGCKTEDDVINFFKRKRYEI